MDRTVLAVLAVASLLGGIAAAAEFRARPAEAVLEDAERTYPRVGVEPDWFPAHWVDRRCYRVDANAITDVTNDDESKHRRVSVAKEYRLHWCGAVEGIAFLIADPKPLQVDWDDLPPARKFHRLDLDTMQWLEPFALPEPSIERVRGMVHLGSTDEPRREVLADHLLVTPRGVVVLCEETIEHATAIAPDMPWRDRSTASIRAGGIRHLVRPRLHGSSADLRARLLRRIYGARKGGR